MRQTITPFLLLPLIILSTIAIEARADHTSDTAITEWQPWSPYMARFIGQAPSKDFLPNKYCHMHAFRDPESHAVWIKYDDVMLAYGKAFRSRDNGTINRLGRERDRLEKRLKDDLFKIHPKCAYEPATKVIASLRGFRHNLLAIE